MHCPVVSKIYHVNEPIYYKDFSQKFIAWNIEGCLSDLLQVFPTYIRVQILWDKSLTDGKGCLLKKIIVDDETIEKIENVIGKLEKVPFKMLIIDYKEL